MIQMLREHCYWYRWILTRCRFTSAIKYAKVKTVRDETGIVVDYEIEGDFPKYGNDDDRADDIAVWLLKTFLEKIKKRHTYRNSEPTTSILTITSNVVYGKYTGAMPDGRKLVLHFLLVLTQVMVQSRMVFLLHLTHLQSFLTSGH